MNNTSIEDKGTTLISVLQCYLKDEVNLARANYLFIYDRFMQSKYN
ncbi:hypothetical protein [Flavobacterium sp. SM2513]